MNGLRNFLKRVYFSNSALKYSRDTKRDASVEQPESTIRLSKVIKVAFHTINAICGVHLFLNYIGGPHAMAGPSMLPTFDWTGDVVIENILSWRLFPQRLSRGDLVTYYSPLDPSRIVCKRVIGLPGDVVCVDPTGMAAPSTEHVLVPKGHLWLVGDNAKMSRDSREYGPVSMSLVRGTIPVRIYPFTRFKVFRNSVNYID